MRRPAQFTVDEMGMLWELSPEDPPEAGRAFVGSIVNAGAILDPSYGWWGIQAGVLPKSQSRSTGPHKSKREAKTGLIALIRRSRNA